MFLYCIAGSVCEGERNKESINLLVDFMVGDIHEKNWTKNYVGGACYGRHRHLSVTDSESEYSFCGESKRETVAGRG